MPLSASGPSLRNGGVSQVSGNCYEWFTYGLSGRPAFFDDGCRVLVDRLWPRGVRRDALHCDVWARDLAPSAGLRSWYHADPGDRWEEFRRRYTDELRASQAVREFVRGIEGVDTVTLLYASKNAAENHALILQEYLQRAAGGATTA